MSVFFFWLIGSGHLGHFSHHINLFGLRQTLWSLRCLKNVDGNRGLSGPGELKILALSYLKEK